MYNTYETQSVDDHKLTPAPVRPAGTKPDLSKNHSVRHELLLLNSVLTAIFCVVVRSALW